MIIGIIIGVLVTLLLLFFYSACRISSMCSREEEKYLDE